MPKVDFREEVANVALAELLEQRGLSKGLCLPKIRSSPRVEGILPNEPQRSMGLWTLQELKPIGVKVTDEGYIGGGRGHEGEGSQMFNYTFS